MNYDNEGMTSGLQAMYQNQEEYEQCQEENEDYFGEMGYDSGCER